MAKNAFGVWEVTVPAQNGAPAIPHESKIKASTISCIYHIGIVYHETNGRSDHHGSAQWRAHLSPPSMDQASRAGSRRLASLRRCLLESARRSALHLPTFPAQEARESAHLRGSRRYLIAGNARGHVQGVHQEHAAPYQVSWIQCHPAHGYHGARLLR